MDLNPREASLKADFSAKLARIREARPGGKSHQDDFLLVARDLFPIYGESDEELRDFMSRAGRILSKGKKRKKTHFPSDEEVETMAQYASGLYLDGVSFDDALIRGLEESGFRYVKGAMGSVARKMRAILGPSSKKAS